MFSWYIARAQINNEFRFWNCSPAEAKGGIYELRTYDLYPGSLLEWEQHWCVSCPAGFPLGRARLTPFISALHTTGASA